LYLSDVEEGGESTTVADSFLLITPFTRNRSSSHG
jgi:hypothetical protein